MPLKKNSLFTYVALLRGINVGGNNIIPMKALQATFVKMGFSGVRTYIQSGNVIFQSPLLDARKLEKTIEQVLSKKYDYEARVVIRSLEEMVNIVKNIPKNWFTDKDKKLNVLFLRHTIDSKKILDDLHPKEKIETVIYQPGVLFWSANTSDLTRTSMVKLSSQKVYKEMTVRNLNTTLKIFELMKTTSNKSEEQREMSILVR